jgi:hypothetical protein
MRRIKVAVVAGLSLLALALSAPAAGAAADPGAGIDQSKNGESKNQLERTSGNRAAAWDCPAGYSCYYTGLDGGGDRLMALRCGAIDLREFGFQDRIFSVHNRGSGVAQLYNFNGTALERKGWVYPEGPGQTGRGNFPTNVGADVIYIAC